MVYLDMIFEMEEMSWILQIEMEISEDDMFMFEKFMDMFNDCDDV